MAAADAAGPSGTGQLARAAQEAFIDGWQQAMWVGTVVIGGLFLYVVARGPRPSSASQDASSMAT